MNNKFTDEDSRWWRDKGPKGDISIWLTTVHGKRRISLSGLIARLEAAERLNATFLEVTDDDSEIDGAVYDAALDAWKKAAGR